ncbi:MAG: LON peptidase substrate-binding domain-containing protein, partial [candidate division WOR-3 bacterium]|nr:LON peptidase substrate-binding domain-containing protein [candidate division WOR-3 bacterium]
MDHSLNIDKDIVIPGELPVLPRNDVIVYPLLILPIAVNDDRYIKLIDNALSSDKLIFVGYTDSNELEEVDEDDIMEFGVVANILKMLRFPDGSVRVLVQGLKRARIVSFSNTSKEYPVAEIDVIEEKIKGSIKEEAMTRNLTDMFRKYVKHSQQLPDEVNQILTTIEEPWKLADFVASNLSIDIEDKYAILTMIDP